MKNAIEKFSSRLNQAEKNPVNSEDKSLEIVQGKETRG